MVHLQERCVWLFPDNYSKSQWNVNLVCHWIAWYRNISYQVSELCRYLLRIGDKGSPWSSGSRRSGCKLHAVPRTVFLSTSGLLHCSSKLSLGASSSLKCDACCEEACWPHPNGCVKPRCSASLVCCFSCSLQISKSGTVSSVTSNEAKIRGMLM